MQSFINYLSIISVVLIFISCSNDLEQIKRLTVDENANVEQATNVEILYSDSAIIRLRIQAPTMRNERDQKKPKREFPDGVKVDFFNVYQEKTSELTAKRGEYLENQKHIVLRDSIVLQNYMGEQLETEELIWNEQDGRIYSNKFVKITRPNEVVIGYGFSSNMEFTKWEIDSVRGVFNNASELLEGDK